MKQQNEQPLGSIINEILKMYRLDAKLTEVRALDFWHKVVGEMIAKHTVDLFIERKVLFVKLDSDAIRNELIYAKSLIVKNINKEAGSDVITDVVFR